MYLCSNFQPSFFLRGVLVSSLGVDFSHMVSSLAPRVHVYRQHIDIDIVTVRTSCLTTMRKVEKRVNEREIEDKRDKG